MSADAEDEQLARELVDAFNAADMSRMRALLADDLKAFVTNAQGDVDEVDGPDEYLRRIEAMDLARASFRLNLTQVVSIREGLVMVMVEVNAARGDKRLHNHAAHLLFIRGGRIGEWWMVEALPAESDEFWGS